MSSPVLPNILLLTVDSLRADALRFLGWDRVVSVDTPVLERFSAECSAFTRAFSHGPYSPSAFSALFTSRYPRDAIVPVRSLRSDRMTIAAHMRQVGYTTVGLHSNPLLSGSFGYDQGFDRFEESLLPWNQPSAGPVLPKRVSYLLSRGMRLLTRRAYLDAGRLNDKALALLAKAPRPTFLWIHYMDVHGPYQSHPSSGWAEKWRSERLWRQAVTEPETIAAEDFQRLVDTYRGEIVYWDQCFGELLDSLRGLGLLENMVLIVTADHGDEFREHGGFSHPRKLFDELLHVPLLMRIPGQTAGCQDRLVGHVDILPTLLQLTGSVAETGHLEGISLLGSEPGYRVRQILADATPDREAARVAVRTESWKYILDEIEGSELLFDLVADPKEERNVMHQVDQSVAEPLQSTVQEYLCRSRDQDEGTEEEGILLEDDQVDAEVLRRLAALGYIEDAEQLRKS